MSADRMPTSRGITRLADIPDGERRDGGPELVIRGEHPVIAMPVLPRRRHEIGQPVQEVKWGKPGVHREPAVFSSNYVGGRIGVEEPLHAEPTHDTPAHLLGERGQIGLGNQSTPAAVDRAIYLRTDKAIYRIEEPAAGSPSSQP